MDASFYLDKFQKTASLLDKKLLKQMRIEVAVVEILECVVIKLYKRSWANPNTDPLNATSRIFFSIWADATSIAKQKIIYTIHAFKLRQLIGYTIESRKFADSFRASFKQFGGQWPNVSVQYGPLTLMQGWLKIQPDNFLDEVLRLCNQFIEIAALVDNTLLKFKR